MLAIAILVALGVVWGCTYWILLFRCEGLETRVLHLEEQVKRLQGGA